MVTPFDLFGKSFGTSLFGVPENGAGRLFENPPVPGMPLTGGPGGSSAPPPGAGGLLDKPPTGAAAEPPAAPMVSMNPLLSPMLGGGAKTLPPEVAAPPGPVGPKGVPPYIPPTVQHNIPASDAGPGTHFPTAPAAAPASASPTTAPAAQPQPAAGATSKPEDKPSTFQELMSRFGELKAGGAAGGGAPMGPGPGGIGGDPAAASRAGAGQLMQGLLEDQAKALPKVGGVPELPEPLMRRFRGR